MYVPPYVLALLAFVTLVRGYNIDTKPYGILNGPARNSYFGYSTEAQQVEGKLKLWTGSPKYRGDSQNSSASEGAIYSCEIRLQSDKSTSNINGNNCEKLSVSAEPAMAPKNSTEEESASTSLPILASSCSFEKDRCGYVTSNRTAWLSKEQYTRLRTTQAKKNTVLRQKFCFVNQKQRSPISGPRSLGVGSGGFLTLNPDRMLSAVPKRSMFTTTLTSTVIQSQGPQCLRFCFNAFSFADDFSLDHEASKPPTPKVHRFYNQPVRSLRVYLKYNNTSELRQLYNFTNPGHVASRNWNFTEIDINHTEIISYQLVFEISILNNVKTVLCTPASDISIGDITVSNRRCKDEAEGTDTLESEQSVGMTLDIQKDKRGEDVITTCGSLWQQNCGFAKESSGICYQFKENSTKPNVIQNPELKGCIRGKMDIVMLIDQSGSVNQCNFQKVKRWLRNIIRGFEIGPKQQDIGVVTYSSKSKINDVIAIGLERYGNNGNEKKKKMLQILHELPYQGGQTFTGLAFEHANNMLWGNASRNDAMKMIILLTDGATTNEDKDNLKYQVAFAKNRSATILSVGVAGYDEKELKGISGETNFFGVRDFSQLEKVRDTLRLAVSNVQLEGSKRSKSMQNCQMGFSVSSNQDTVVMGGPGCFDHVGDAFSYGDYETTVANKKDLNPTQDSPIQDITLPPDQPRENSGTKVFDIPDLEDIEGILRKELADSYLGYSVAVGKFYGEAEGTYSAASAPKYNGKGCVIVYKVSSAKHIARPRILMGQKYGEYFGASLCAEDVNGDGFTDLFVGAPLHSDVEPDEGRVFVYMGGKYLSEDPDIILVGSGKPFSRFGLVVSSVGDINADSIPDIVVSAPNEDEGSGAIYIFPGTTGRLKPKLSQRVSARDLPDSEGLHLFGQSVSGNADVDHNGYNDIFVGTPGSDQIIILRSRPVVRIAARFFIIDDVIDRKNENCWSGSNASVATVSTKIPCLLCTACFSYDGLSLPESIGIRYEIHPDILETTPRLRFHENTANHPFHVDTASLYGVKNEYCFNHTLYLQKDIDDLMTKVMLQMKFDMIVNETQQYEGSTSGEEMLMPALDIYTEQTLDDVAVFLLDCQHNLSCKADISINGSHAIMPSGKDMATFDYSLGGILRFFVTVENHGPEEAHSVSVEIGYSPHLSYSATKSNCLMVDRDDSAVDTKDDLKHISMSLKRTFLRSGEVCTGELNFIIMSVAEKNRIGSVHFFVNSSTISLNDSLENNVLDVTVPIKYWSSFTISGDTEQSELYQPASLDQSNMSSSTNPLIENIAHTYMINNNGKLKLRNLTIQVMWPICVSVNGTDAPLSYDGTVIKEMNPPVILDESRVLNASTYGCNTTESIDEVYSECVSKSVKFCSYLTIFVPEIPVYGDITFSVSSSMHWSHIRAIEKIIKLVSEVSIPVNTTIGSFSQDQSFHYTVSTTIRPPFQSSKKEETEGSIPPWWIYVVGALIGLLLLLLFAFAMKRAGFFKSRYADKKKLAEDDAYFHELCQPMTSNS